MLEDLMGLLISIRVTDIVDIIIVAFLLYKLLEFIKETRAQQLFRGILLIVAAFIASEVFDLSLLNWLLTSLVTVGLIAVVIVFQPEIRRALEQLGRRGFITGTFRDLSKEESYATVHMLVDAADDFSSTRTGALIAIEQETTLADIIETGVVIDGEGITPANVLRRMLMDRLETKLHPNRLDPVAFRKKLQHVIPKAIRPCRNRKDLHLGVP